MDLTERMERFEATKAEFEGYTKICFHLQRSGLELAEQYYEVWDECVSNREKCRELARTSTNIDEATMTNLEMDAERMRLAIRDFEGCARMRVQGHRMALLKLMDESEDRPEFTADFVAELRAVLSDRDWAWWGYPDSRIQPKDWSGSEELLWRQSWYRSYKKLQEEEAKRLALAEEMMNDLNMTRAYAEPPRRSMERPQPY